MSAGQWLNGPARLSVPINNSSQEQQMLSFENCDNMKVVPCIFINTPPTMFEFTRWSSYCKTLNVVAWIMRFIANYKPKGMKLTSTKVKLDCSVHMEVYLREIQALRQ